MAASDFSILTVENTGGALALKRKPAAEVLSETANPVYSSVDGNPAVIPDAVGGRAFRSVAASVEAVQAGSGDPSPTNVRPITGWIGANITVSPTLDAEDGTTYTVTFPAGAGTVYGGTLDLTAGTLTVTRKKLLAMAWTRITVSDHYVFAAKAADKAQNYNILCSHYKPVQKARTGLLDKEIGVYNNTENLNRITIRDDRYTDAESFTEHMRDVDVVYELATPIVYQLSPVQITALSGYNAVFADCGSVSVEYTQDTGAAIDAGDASTRAMIGEVSGETASRSLAVGEYVTVGDKLYRVTSAIGAGETLVPGSNVTETTVGAELSRLAAMIS